MQEWDAWTRNKLVDFLVPMVFLRHDAMAEAAAKALKSCYDRHLYVGVAGWVLSPQLAVKQIRDATTAGATGVVLFSYHYLGPNSDAATCVKAEDLVSSVFCEEVALPVMPWKQ
ncbi:MAG: hypothetical protein GTN93_05810 [Anaerolineae bacterium]|nr:hypothetical protein [Anaerolineae bacterium]